MPSAVTVGDFNRDSRLDMAVANEFSSDVSVLLGRGDGTFNTAVNYAAGSAPAAIASGDFNGDQRIDLAVANAGSTNVAILLGNGNGSFQSPVGYGVGEVPRAVTVADFNRDGRLDLALANRISANVSVLLGRGDGTFQNANSYGAGIDPVSVAAADFNGDSSVDLAVANAALFEDPANVSVLIARTGGFRNAVNYDAGVSPRAVAVGDFNRDGRADLAVANFGGFVGSQFTNSSVSVLLGNGDGTFATAVNHRAQDGPVAVVAADVNANGLLDMVVVNNRSRTLSLLSGRGDGTFHAPLNFAAGFGAKSLALGDFNGDTHPDVAVANDTGALVLLSVCLTNADLSITKMDAPDPVAAGSNLTYTLIVTNAGPAPAPDAMLIDPLPAGVSFLSATSSQGNCANNAGTVNCNLGNLPVAGTASVTITVGTATSGRFTNTATVASSMTIDQNPANNSATVTTTVLPLISIAATDSTASEAGANPGVFTVRRTGSTSGPLAVNYAIAGTAANGIDYTDLSGTVTIPNGAASTTITVAPIDELAVEPTEFVIATLATNAGYLINSSSNSALISLLDDDVYGLSVNDVSVTESGAGAISAVFTVSLSYAHTQTVTVNFSTADGSASAPADYLAASGQLTFAPGNTSQSVTVTVLDDPLNEADETFAVNLFDPLNGVIIDGQGRGTINNEDPLPSLGITDATLTEGDTGSTNAIFTVSLSTISGQIVTINFASTNGTATAGPDYGATNGMLVFPPGVTTQSVTVTVTGERLNEADETFLINLINPTNVVVSDSQAIGTITNDDPLPTLSVNDVTVTEGDTGTTSATFTVSLSAVSGQTVSIGFTTADGTAMAGNDYFSTNGTLVFPPGTVTQNVSVRVIGERPNEIDEFFLLLLSAPVNVIIGDGQGRGTINNDDPLPGISITDVTVTEGPGVNAVLTVSLTAISGQTVTVNFATADGTATAPIDYAGANGTLTFPPGTISQNVTVAVLDDALNEANETFLVNLSNAGNALINDGQGRSTISNDDPLPRVSIADLAIIEGDSSAAAVFNVRLATPSGQTVTLNFATTDETAIAGADYQAASGLLVFAPGVVNQDIAVTITGERFNELDETFLVNLSNPTNVVISDGQATGTITNDDPLPTLSINDVAVTEGASGAVNAVFTVSLSAASGQRVTVNFATGDGTASAGDYQPAGGSLVFAPGVTTQTLSVSANGDLLNEPDETFLVNLSGPINALFGDSQGAGTILNDDAPVTISDLTIVEGNSGSTLALLTVSLGVPVSRAVTVDFATADDTAIAGADYFSTNGTLRFAPGTTTQTIPVRIIGEVFNEDNETFLVNLSNPTNAMISDAQATGTISNDDPLPGLLVSDVALAEGNAGATNAVFIVRLSAPSGRSISVNYATADGLANVAVDYISTNGTLNFAPGTSNQTVIVAVLGDVLNESNETFFVNLSNPNNSVISDGEGVGTINNDDPMVAITISDTAVVEGNSGSTNAVFTVSLSGVSGQSVTVNYATASGTTAGNDYTSANGTLRFNPGQTNQTISVAISGDSRREENETFFVNLSSPVNATLGDAQGLGTILNDEGVPSISIDDVSVTEGSGVANAVLTVRLSATSSQVVTVRYQTADGTALAGSDYTTTNGVLSFPSGTTSQAITVRVIGDALDEATQAFFVNLSNATNAVVSDAQATVTILDDDAAVPSLAIDDVTVLEGSTGASAVLTARLSAPHSQVVTVRYETADGTALAGSDYTATNGLLSFPAGTTTQAITVRVIGDLLNEPTQSFFVNLSNATNAPISDAQAAVTILDDDEAVPSISIDDAFVNEGSSGTSVVLTVRLSAISSQVVTVRYQTADGTAVAGGDYTTTNGLLSFPSGATIQSIPVRIIGDLLNEPTETFFVNLSAATNALIGDAQAVVTIMDDDTRITALEVAGANVLIRFTSAANRTYRLERTDALPGNPWVTVGNDVAGTGGIVQMQDLAGAGRASRFYRILLLPQP